MIVDCALYAGETEMLELRMRALAHVVDLFVVVWCERTHQGDYAEIPPLPSLRVGVESIVYGVAPSLELQRKNGETWTRPEGERGPALSPWFQHVERQHRNGVSDAVRSARVPPEALVLISDVDEIPDPRVLAAWHDTTAAAHATRGYENGGAYIGYVLEQRFHSTALELLHPHQPWLGTCATKAGLLTGEWPQPESARESSSPQALRNARPDPEMIKIPHAGWHLSWFGTDAERQRKLETFSHAELTGRFDPAEGRRTGTHANGEHLSRLSAADVERLDWPAPITDGTFVVPEHWRSA